MKQGICLPTDTDVREIAELGVAAEATGWDGVFLWDTLLDTDPWVALAAVAVRTERVRIGPMITPVARRRPWKLACESATLDRLSNGRLILPVGLGVAEDERWHRLGMDTEMDRRVRAQLLDEGLEVLTKLWSGESADYDGERFRVHDARLSSPPLQQPRPPIWVVSRWPDPPRSQLRRMLRWDGVCVSPKTDVRALLAFVRAERGASAPFDVLVEGNTSEHDLGALEDSGVSWWLEAVYDEPRRTGAGMRARIEQGPTRR